MSPISAIRGEWREAKESAVELYTFVREHNWRQTNIKKSLKRHWGWWLMLVVLIVFMILAALYKTTILDFVTPKKEQLLEHWWWTLVPVGILIVMSIPPLGGHEIVLLLTGLLWGPLIGAAICAAGSILGEAMCFFAFKHFFSAKARSIEEASILYACVSRLMGQGGVIMVTIVRYSAIPGHVITAIQSTVGMSFWLYLIAVVLSIPKSYAFVYLGVALGRVKGEATPDELREQSLINWAVTIAVGLGTAISFYIVYTRARRLYPAILEESLTRRMEKGRSVQDAEFQVLNVSLAEATMDGVDAEGHFPEDERQRLHMTKGKGELKYYPEEGRSWQDGPARPVEGAQPWQRSDSSRSKKREQERLEQMEMEKRRALGDESEDEEAAPRYEESSLLGRELDRKDEKW